MVRHLNQNNHEIYRIIFYDFFINKTYPINQKREICYFPFSMINSQYMEDISTLFLGRKAIGEIC